MAWTAPQHSKTHVTQAGKTFIDSSASLEERALARAIVNNWRSAHAYPLNTIQVTLRQRARRVETDPIIAQRTKRLPSIKAKLERFPTMGLARMQDIAGCRAIMDNVDNVRELEAAYIEPKRRRTQIIARHDNYIAVPKDDGYRGVHVVVTYGGAQQKAWDGLKVEVQIRSRLMHAWATALETVDTFTRQQLKTGKGQPNWKRFFALMSSEIALIENCPSVPGTPESLTELRRQLKQQAQDLQVIDRLESYAQMLRVANDVKDSKSRWFLLRLDLSEKNLHLTPFDSPAQAEEAYGQLEATEDTARSDGRSI
jgi:ppGpp synthetase/RelA/SpoT-type nucleotidyltranferase